MHLKPYPIGIKLIALNRGQAPIKENSEDE